MRLFRAAPHAGLEPDFIEVEPLHDPGHGGGGHQVLPLLPVQVLGIVQAQVAEQVPVGNLRRVGPTPQRRGHDIGADAPRSVQAAQWEGVPDPHRVDWGERRGLQLPFPADVPPVERRDVPLEVAEWRVPAPQRHLPEPREAVPHHRGLQADEGIPLCQGRNGQVQQVRRGPANPHRTCAAKRWPRAWSCPRPARRSRP